MNSRNDQLFIACGAKKPAFAWFNKMGVTNSYITALKKNDAMSNNFDEKVKQWKKEHEEEDKKMKDENFDLGNKSDVADYRINNLTPATHYQVNFFFKHS